MVIILMSSIFPHAGMSTFEASIIMILIQLPLIMLVLWIIHRLAQLSSLFTSMHIMERGIPFIPLCIFSGIRMM